MVEGGVKLLIHNNEIGVERERGFRFMFAADLAAGLGVAASSFTPSRLQAYSSSEFLASDVERYRGGFMISARLACWLIARNKNATQQAFKDMTCVLSAGFDLPVKMVSDRQLRGNARRVYSNYIGEAFIPGDHEDIIVLN